MLAFSKPLSKPVAGLVVGFAVLFAPLFLFFGIVELLHPDVGPESLAKNAIACIAVILFGLGLIVVAIAAFRETFLRHPPTSSEHPPQPLP